MLNFFFLLNFALAILNLHILYNIYTTHISYSSSSLVFLDLPILQLNILFVTQVSSLFI